MSFPVPEVLPHALWRKSSYSGGGNDTCVEVANVKHVVAVRDSKNPHLPALGFSRREFRALTNGIREA